MATALGPVVKGFLGENRLLPDDLLTPNFAVDGQNVDYGRGTIRKRLGMSKTHASAYVKGGVRFENANNNQALVILDQSYLDLVGDFTVECIVRVESDPSAWASAALIFGKRSAAAGADGWGFFYLVGSAQWRFFKYDSGGTIRQVLVNGNITAAVHPAVGESFHLSVWRTGTTMQMRATRLSDGETATSSSTTCSGDTNNTANAIAGAQVGATPGNQVISFTMDELRIWNDQRSTTELDDCKFRELTESEIADPSLIGYWPLNDSENTTLSEDLSFNNNPAFLSSAPPAHVASIMPNAGSSNFALQGNGIDAYATAPYNAEYAPILNTERFWVIEFWARLDASIEWPNNAVLCQLGSTTTGNGHAFSIYITWPGSGAAPLLKYSYSTATTANNTEVTPSTAFNPEPGVPFHVRLFRLQTTITLYVNNTVIDQTTVPAENGPTSSTSYGMTFLARNSAGTYSLLAPCTIDEVRLWWSGTGGSPTGYNAFSYWQTEYPDINDRRLVGYWKFNAGNPLLDSAATSNAVLVPSSEDKPSRTRGMAYPADPADNIKLIGPVSVPVLTTNTNQGQALFSREFLIATREAFFSQRGTTRNWLKDLEVPGSDSLYHYARYTGKLICCNGVGRNYAYNGNTVPASVTLPTSSTTPTATPTGAGGGWIPADGSYTYRFTWYNANLDIEGPYWGQVAATMATATHDTCNITNVPSSVTGYPSVTHWRLYRLDPGGTVYRRRTQVAIGTTTFNDDGTSVATGTALHTTRTHLDPQNIAEVYNNRLFFARGSTLVYSDADTLDFSNTSSIFVDRDDGEVITGLKAYAGQLVVFKKTSIHVLDGDGPTTFQMRKIHAGVGCVSATTVAASPQGVYFLGHDGVYLYNGGVEYISHSQQPLFSRISHDVAYRAVGVYHPETHQYYVSFDAFTEGTQDGAKIAGEAIDLPEFSDLFTHYYRCKTFEDATGLGADHPGTNTNVVTDDTRGSVWSSTGAWTLAGMTFRSTPQDDGTYGCWIRSNSATDVVAESQPLSFGSPSNQGLALTWQTPSGVNVSRKLVSIEASTSGSSLNAQVGTVETIATRWKHFVIVKRGTVFTVFFNGKRVLSTDVGADADLVQTSLSGCRTFTGQPDCIFDNIFVVADLALTDEQIEAIYMYETTVQVLEGVTIIFDEETKSWARHDKPLDYLAVSEQSSQSAEAVAGINCFIARLNEGSSDLARNDGDTAQLYTRSGSLASATGLKITDSNATFPTTGHGYAGVEVVFVPTDTTQETQRRIIIKNTATVMYLDAPLITSFTGTYYIGPIELVWESPWIQYGTEGLTKVFQYLQLYQQEIASNQYTVRFKTDAYNDDWVTLTIPSDEYFVRKELTAPSKGRRIKIRIEDTATRDRTEVRSYQFQFREQELVQ